MKLGTYWFSKTLEPILEMLKRALPAGFFVFCSCYIVNFTAPSNGGF